MTFRTLLALALLAFTASASAQETYSLPASANNVTTLTGVITAQNGALCAAYGLARTCTQAQVCAAAGATGGSGCTAAQARNAGVRIFPLTQAGREEFAQHKIAAPKFAELISEQQAENRRSFCEAWNAANQTQRDSACTAIGASDRM